MIEAEIGLLKQTLGHHKDDKCYFWEAVLKHVMSRSLSLYECCKNKMYHHSAISEILSMNQHHGSLFVKAKMLGLSFLIKTERCGALTPLTAK